MRLILNQNGKTIAIYKFTEVMRREYEGKSEIFFYGYNRKAFIRIPVEAADILMNCFLLKNEMSVEKACFEKWETAYTEWLRDYTERKEEEKW